MPEVIENNGEIDGLPVFWRSADPGAVPVLYLHGVPTNSDDWSGFLSAGGGLAPDLPGFGRSGKPGHYDYSIAGYERFIEQFLDLVGVTRVRLVVHDWGAVGLAFAQRHPECIERLVIIDAVPLLGGYSWHRVARAWRTPLLGELLMGASARPLVRRLLAGANVAPLGEPFLDTVLDHFDQGTQRAILRLYRSAPGEVLEAAGLSLGLLNAPALVVWGERDPYIPQRFAEEYAAALGGETRVEKLPDAGHWPWLDRPDLVARVVGFLDGT